MIAVVGSFLGAFFLMALQWYTVDRAIMLNWFAIFSFFHIVRAIFIFRFNKIQPGDDECVIWGKGLAFSSLFAGLIWSLGVYLTFVPGNLAYQLTVSIITVGLSAGAVSSLSVLRPAFMAFVIPIMLSIVILFLLEMTYITSILSISMFLTMLYILRGANNLYVSSMVNFRLLLEAADREKLLLAAKETAEIATRTQAEFLDNMSHELRTPLHGIMGFAQVGTEKTKDLGDESNYKYFLRIIESGQRLKVLLDDLLDLRKIEEGKIVLDIKKNNIHEIISECIYEQEAVINQHQLNIVCDFDETIGAVNCDKFRIGQVVMNILNNAIKHSPAGGNITFSSCLAKNILGKDVVKISICDQGPGIAEEEHESIFNKFVQVKKSVTNSGSTGLGLAITKEIILAHKGEVWLNNNDDVGATFYFTLRL
ncbi:MAG: HAMP domain-containing histidine kinase [Gammaproteobacteria bacterium]|nr:HAMP domain-containing histidine kinase [Gammaproteobacteria bacterium]